MIYNYINAFKCCDFGNIGSVEYSSLIITLTKDGNTMFIPTYCIPVMRRILEDQTARRVVISVPKVSSHEIYRSPRTILNRLFRIHNYNYSRSFSYVDTRKGYGYYGGNGIILTEDYSPLIICGFEIGPHPNIRYEYVNAICYVSPRVFTGEDMMSKFIIRHLIPFYSACTTQEHYDGNGNYVAGKRVKVIISDDIDKLICTPVETSGNNADDGIYDVLSDNIHVLSS